MVDMIYQFILNNLIGNNTALPNADLMATLLSYACIVLIFGVLVRFVVWLFKCVSGAWIWRK